MGITAADGCFHIVLMPDWQKFLHNTTTKNENENEVNGCKSVLFLSVLTVPDTFLIPIQMKDSLFHMLIRVLVLVLSIFPALRAGAQEYSTDGSNLVIRVEGTDMAKLISVEDIFEMIPEIILEDGVLTVVGRGTPAVFIEDRRITDLTELSHLPADRVSEIEIIRHPGAGYDKDSESVILIRLRKDTKEGLTLDNTLRMDLTSALATNEEVSLEWKHKGLSMRAFLGWNEKRQQSRSESYVHKYKDHKLIEETVTVAHPKVSKKWLTGRLSLSYGFNEHSHLDFNYSLLSRNNDRTRVPESTGTSHQPETRHDLALSYSGKIGVWDVNLGNNSFIDDAETSSKNQKSASLSLYKRKDYDLRTYARMSRKFSHGSLDFGAEHELEHMEVTMYEDNPSFSPLEKRYYHTHAMHPDNTIGLFTSGSWEHDWLKINLGMRYEYHHYVYRPCDDDGLMIFINEIGDVLKQYIERYLPDDTFLWNLYTHHEVGHNHHYLIPSLKVSADLGGSELSLDYTQNIVRPYLGITRLRFNEINLLKEKVLWTERASVTSLGWKYKWADVLASYSYYNSPVCKMSMSNQYNAPDYGALDLNLKLSPKIGFWSPMLLAHLHKQWFDMPLASGKDVLKKPLLNLELKNTLSLPGDWLIRLDASWHSRGADRNIYYYSTDLDMDVSVQKSFPRQGLTVVVDATNVLRNSYNDISLHSKAYNGVSQGSRSRQPRMVSLSLRYKL